MIEDIKAALRDKVESGQTLVTVETLNYLKTAYLQETDQWEVFVEWKNGIFDEVVRESE